MKKYIVVVALSIGLGLLAKRFGPKVQNMEWEKRLERMPDNAPPKWMCQNITAIRANTERVLDLLEQDRVGSADTATADT